MELLMKWVLAAAVFFGTHNYYFNLVTQKDLLSRRWKYES